MTMLFVVAGLTVLISSMCSLFEATLYSTRMGSLEAERAEGKHDPPGRAVHRHEGEHRPPDLRDPDTQHDCEHGRSNTSAGCTPRRCWVQSGSRRSPSV